MKNIQIFDPALCCSSGVCGTDVDRKLVDFSSDVDWAMQNGLPIERFNLAQQPMAFADNAAVKGLLERSSAGALPITLVDGEVALAGRYPTRDDLARWLATVASASELHAADPQAAASGTCCAGGACCESGSIAFDGMAALTFGLAESIDMKFLDRPPRFMFFTGKGGVGKTTLAAAIAVELAMRGLPVHLTTSDPAAHLMEALDGKLEHLTVSRIDPHEVTEQYRAAVLASKGAKLDAAGAYHRDVVRQLGSSGRHFTTPMMQLQDPKQTKVLIVTLAETTPVLEAANLQTDLRRAGIEPWAWVINNSVAAAAVTSPLLQARARNELGEIEAVASRHASRYALVPLLKNEPTGVQRLQLLSQPGA